MPEKTSKICYEHYAKVATKRLEEMREELKIDSYIDCKTREEFCDYLALVFIAYYGLRCTCDDQQDWEFRNLGGHYHHCELWRFSKIVQNCLDWKEKHEVTGNSSQR